MTDLDTDAIDREIAMRRDEVAAMSATLMELDDHPGLQHVRRYPPTGVTAARWAAIEGSLAQLWQDLGLATTILDAAEAARARRSKPSDDDRAELTRLLCGRPVETSRQAIPMAQRRITDPAEAVECVGLAELVGRMSAAHPAVVEFCDAVDAVDSLIAERLAPSRRQLDAAGLAGPVEIAELLAVSATDPLSLTEQAIGDRVMVIADWVARRAAELAELAAVQSDWPRALQGTAARLDALHAATGRAQGVRTLVADTVVTGPLPTRVDAEPGLRAALAAISVPTAEPDAAALLRLRLRIDAAVRLVADDERLLRGLLDRHRELAGRLTVYRAKAARLGRGEESELLASGRIAAGLLSRRPCDLRAVTRAVNDFQRMVLEKRGDVS